MIGRPFAVLGIALIGIAGIALWSAPPALRAERTESLPKELQDVGVTEHLGAQVPRDLEFVDSDGKTVTLGQYFDGKRPLILTMNYSNCPMLCSLQLNGLFDALEKMKWDLGNQFEMITVSFDPSEKPPRAKATKQKYLQLYGRPGAAEGYHFLTGRERNIKKLTETIGFHYKYVPDTGQYVHVAATMILMPDGRVARYLYGVAYDPQTIRLSLLEAGEGKVGSTLDKALLFCFHYDAERGRYGLAAFRLMQISGGLAVVIVGAVIWRLRRREKKNTEGDSPIFADHADQRCASVPVVPEKSGQSPAKENA
jgi:protein SCO1/2